MADDEIYYEIVAGELAAGQVRKGLWTQALALSDYDEPRTKAQYIRLRVGQLRKSQPRILEVLAKIRALEAEVSELSVFERQESADHGAVLTQISANERELAKLRTEIAALSPLRNNYRLKLSQRLFLYGLLGILPSVLAGAASRSVALVPLLLPAGLLVALVAWLLARSAMLEKQPEIRPAIRRWKAAWAEHDVVYDRVFQARYTREQLARRLEATRKEAGDAAAELERLRQGISGDHS